MAIGARVSISGKRWNFSSRYLPSNPCLYSWRGKSALLYSRRLFGQPCITEERECVRVVSLRARSSQCEGLTDVDVSFASRASEVNTMREFGGVPAVFDTWENVYTNVENLKANSILQFSLLMEGINDIEDMLADRDMVRLEGDILAHIRRLGALKLFHACMSRTLVSPHALNSSTHFTGNLRQISVGKHIEMHKTGVVVKSGKKEYRKSRRARASTRAEKLSLSPNTSRLSGSLKSGNRRNVKAQNESEMSRGVKEIAELERTLREIETETQKKASYTRWAEASGLDEKTLYKQLQFGWYCRDELIRSTHSLVVYIAKNYRGMGIAFDDLIQAGIIGVLKGAERFDGGRGYKFSTYVQYWVKKGMLAFIAKHSRGIRIPVSMEKTVNRVKKARRTLYARDGRWPHDDEIAKLSGISLANVQLANKCTRVEGSIFQEISDKWPAKFMELTPDMSVQIPEEAATRVLMKNDIIKILDTLHPKERQVLELRYGLDDGRCKSLGEIGQILRVTKEWIRKLEKTALQKIRDESIQKEMKYYIQ